ncbi:Translation initiation factor eIF-2B subunit epsilon [Bulinus truncatus]|nr:Translation initiation factor eIF-2B subunit epsilon [Bulinus truncatus]
MAPKAKSRKEDLEEEFSLQAVVIADSFNVRFGSVTHKKPRALLPLVNIPLLDYTLEALAISGVKDVFVFCCHLGDQIREHIKQSKWQDGGSSMTVTALMLDSCRSMGDVLRDIDAKSFIRNDFLLLSGDIVSNMDLGQIVKEHRERTRGKDKSSVMTMVFKKALPGHRSRSKEDSMHLIEEGETKRLLHFEKCLDKRKFKIPTDILLEHDDIIYHNDLMDCQISICSPVVPTLFTDNFDYQTRENFVKGILINEEIMGHKIHISIIQDKYAARVSNLQTYDAISKDIIARWTYPLVPDMFGSANGERIQYGRHNIYCSGDVTLARGCDLQKEVVVGRGTSIGKGTVISSCVIGRNCHIGEDVKLRNSFLWDNVIVENGCDIDTALLCSDVKVLSNVVISKGVVLSWEVVVGPDVSIKSGEHLMSEPQQDDWDEGNQSFGEEKESSDDRRKDSAEKEKQNTVEFGSKCRAFPYNKQRVDSDDEEEGATLDHTWGLSTSESEERASDEECDSSSGESGEAIDGDEDMYECDDGDGEDQVDSSLGFNPNSSMLEMNSGFYTELLDTFVRASAENISHDNLTLEINSLKHAFNVPIEKVIYSLPCVLYDLAARENSMPVTASPKILAAFKKESTTSILLDELNSSSRGGTRNLINCGQHGEPKHPEDQRDQYTVNSLQIKVHLPEAATKVDSTRRSPTVTHTTVTHICKSTCPTLRSLAKEAKAQARLQLDKERIDREERLALRNLEKEKLEMKKLDADRQERLEKEKLDRQERLEKEKLEMKKLDADRQERLEKEKIQLEIKRLEAEIEMKRIDSEQHTKTLQKNNTGGRPHIAQFNSKDGNIDAYLANFESILTVNNIPESEWTKYVLEAFRGESVSVLQMLGRPEHKSYNEIKQHLLDFHNKTEEHYRNLFHNSIMTETEHPTAYINKLESYLNNYIKMAGINASDPQQIIELMLVDKILNISSSKLFSFIKLKKVNCKKDLISTLSDYKDSNQDVPMFKSKNDNTFSAIRHKNKSQYSYNDNRYRSLPARFPNRMQRTCYYCHNPGHNIAKCKLYLNRNRYVNNGQVQESRYIPNRQYHRNSNDRSSGRYQGQYRNRQSPNNSPPRHNNDRGRSLNRNNKVHNVNALLSNNGNLIFYPCFLNNKPVMCLRDTGATCVVVDVSLVPHECMMDSSEDIKLGNGHTLSCKKAMIDIDTPWISGKIEAIAMTSPVAPLIIDGMV